MKKITAIFLALLFANTLTANENSSIDENKILQDAYNRLLGFYSYGNENQGNKARTSPQALKLENAVALAYNNNTTLRAYRSEFESAVEVYPQAFSTWLPQASLDFSYNQFFDSANNNLGSGSSTPNYGLSASVSMNLFESFGGVKNIESAGSLVVSLAYDYYNKEQTVVLDVVQAYLETLKGFMTVNLRQQQAKALKEHFASVEVGLRVGSATRTDLSQAKSRYLEALSLAQIATVDYNRAKLDLERMLGVNTQGLKVPSHLKLQYRDLNSILRAIQDKNPTYLSAFYNNDYYEKQVSVSRSKLLPRVDASVAYNYNAYDDESLDYAGGNVTLNIPLYDAGIYRSQLRASKKNAEQTKFLLEDSVKQLRASARVNLETLKANLIYIDAIASQVDASFEALKGVKIEYSVGTKTNTDLLDAESDYYETQVNLVNAYMEYLISQYNILFITGDMGMKDLKTVPVKEVYDPNLYVEKIKHRFFLTSTPDDIFIDRESNK